MGACRALFVMACWTSSFDLFLNIRVGINLRFCQFCLLLAMGLYLSRQIITRSAHPIRLHAGQVPIWLWALVVVIMGWSASDLFARGLGYGFWAILSVLTIALAVQAFDTKASAEKLVKAYLIGIVAVGMFGIVQFALGILGLPTPLVQQWWTDAIPRINGFSYEPSYFATYLMLGYVTLSYVADAGVGGKSARLGQFLLLVAILLSSSRMGLLLLMLWELSILGRRLAIGVLKKSKPVLIIAPLLAVALGGLAITAVNRFGAELEALSFLLAGIGLGGQSAHSVDGRTEPLIYTAKVFMQHPIAGVGLGSVAERIAAMQGVAPSSYEELKEFEGMSVFAEILAGTGLIGLALFVAFLAKFIMAALASARQYETRSRKIIYGMVWGLLVELILLQMNQNVLRPYVWCHLAVLAVLMHAPNSARAPFQLNSGTQNRDKCR